MSNRTDNNKVQVKKALLDALEKSLGIVTAACKSVGVKRNTFYKYYKEDEEFRQAVDDIENVAIDVAESSLMKQIREGNTAATIFYLKTKGKRRGYVESQNFDITSNGKAFKGFDFLAPIADEVQDEQTDNE